MNIEKQKQLSTDEQIKQIGEAIEKVINIIAEFVNRAIEFIKQCVNSISEAYEKIVSSILNKKIYNLAYYHKKARVRKKNQKRIIKTLKRCMA